MTEKIKTVEVTFEDSPLRFVWHMDNPKTDIDEPIKFLEAQREKVS